MLLLPDNFKPIDLLAITAQPGDAEQTCGGTLLRMAEAGYRTGILDLSGPTSNDETAARHLKVAWRGNIGFPASRLENSLPARMTLVGELRRLRPRAVILPHRDARNPDHYRTAELAYESCFLAGLPELDEGDSVPHRPSKVLYAAMYANVNPSFVVDVTTQFERRLAAAAVHGAFDRELASSIARYYGNLIGARFGEPFVVKETLRVDDVLAMNVSSF